MNSVVVGGAIVGMEKKLPTTNNTPMPDQQPAVAPRAPAGVGSHAHASVEAANQVEQRRLDAMQRLAAKQRQKKLEQQQQQARTATGAAPPAAAAAAMLVPPTQDPSLVSAARMLAQNNGPAPGAGAGAQQPGLPMHGNARPPALRPNQPPQAQGGGGGVARTNSMQRTKSVGQNVVGGGPKVAGTLPSLNVGAGMVKAAAGHMEAMTGGAGGQAYGADGIGADGVAFQSARGMKRSADHQGG